jgi:hypothetical protein
VIYAIEAMGTGFIKFGYTKDNVNRRLGSLQTGCPADLRLLAWCEGDMAAECWIHWRLSKAKAFQRGEWFKDGPEAQKIIQEMIEDNLQPELVPTGTMTVARQRHKRLGAALAASPRSLYLACAREGRAEIQASQRIAAPAKPDTDSAAQTQIIAVRFEG